MYRKRENNNRANIRRLKQLKQKLKPYRDKHTMDCIRVITKSFKLNEHWETLESVLTEGHTYQDVKKCLQNVVNKITVNGERAKFMMAHRYMTADVVEKVRNIDINSSAMAINEINPFKINSSALNHLNPFKINSSALNHLNPFKINSSALNEMNPFKINSSAIHVNKVNCLNISPPAMAANKVSHININSSNSSANYVNKVNRDNIEASGIVINKFKHMHIHGCRPKCYNRDYRK